MKKTISILAVLLLVCAAVFATEYNINFGAGYSINSGSVASKLGTNFTKEPELRHSGVDLHFGFNAELSNHVVVYENLGINFVQTDSFKVKNKDYDWTKVSEVWDKNPELDNQFLHTFMLTDDLGAGYAFHFNQVRLITGVGFHLELLTYRFKENATTGVRDKENGNANVGFNFLIQSDYQINKNFSIMCALKPSVNISNAWKQEYSVKADDSDTALGYNLSAVLGASFRF